MSSSFAAVRPTLGLAIQFSLLAFQTYVRLNQVLKMVVETGWVVCLIEQLRHSYGEFLGTGALYTTVYRQKVISPWLKGECIYKKQML